MPTPYANDLMFKLVVIIITGENDENNNSRNENSRDAWGIENLNISTQKSIENCYNELIASPETSSTPSIQCSIISLFHLFHGLFSHSFI